MVRRGKRSIESAVPPAGSIYIACCRLSSRFRRKLRGKEASLADFSDPAMVTGATCSLHVMSALCCRSSECASALATGGVDTLR
jgi:hypothetical protein